MPITRSAHNDHLVISIHGRMDARFIQTQREMLDKLPREDNSGILFDLSNTNFIDSSGIGFLVYVYKRITPKKRAMAILGLNGQPKEVVEMLHINRLIDCSDSINAFETKAAAKIPARKRVSLRTMARNRIFIKSKVANRA